MRLAEDGKRWRDQATRRLIELSGRFNGNSTLDFMCVAIGPTSPRDDRIGLWIEGSEEDPSEVPRILQRSMAFFEHPMETEAPWRQPTNDAVFVLDGVHATFHSIARRTDEDC